MCDSDLRNSKKGEDSFAGNEATTADAGTVDTVTVDTVTVDSSGIDDRGSIEAGLVLIPTTILFLFLMQLVLAGSWQISKKAALHDFVVRSEIADSNDSKFYSSKELDSPSSKFSSRDLLNVRDREVSEVGSIRRYELRSEIPTLSKFFEWIGHPIMIKNTVLSLT